MQCVLAFQLESWYAETEMNRSFDLCEDSGTGTAFFPADRHAMVGTFEEVECEGNWKGSEGKSLWNGSCMANDPPFWPGTSECSNQGTKHPFLCAVMQFWFIYSLRVPAPVSGWDELFIPWSRGLWKVMRTRTQMSEPEDGLNEKRERTSTRDPEALLAPRGELS
jgi:hypothetical protein